MVDLDPLAGMGAVGAPQTPEEQAGALARLQGASGFVPLIRSWADLNFWTTDEQREAFEKWLRDKSPNRYNLANEPGVTVSWVSAYKTPHGSVWYVYRLIKDALQAGKARIPLDALIGLVNRVWDQVGWTTKPADWVQRHLLTAVDLARGNLDYAAYRVAKAAQADRSKVVEAARAFGIRTDISDDDLGGALTAQIADAATTQGLTIPQAVDIYGDAGPQGAGSTLSELWNDAKDWILDTVVKNIGRALAWVGEQILKARENVPYLGTYFLDPLGFSLTAEALRQVGNYFRTGDAAASFNERVLGFELGRHWTAFGQALIVAGGILIAFGGPLAVLGILMEVVGILMYAAGSTILGEMRAREAASQARAAEKELDTMETKLQQDCAAQLEAQGVPKDQIPKNADKCVKLYQQTQEEKSEILSPSQPAPEADHSALLKLLTLAAVGYLLTRR